jgi:hypothetical protein
LYPTIGLTLNRHGPNCDGAAKFRNKNKDPEETTMSGSMLAVGAAIALACGVFLHFSRRRARRSRIPFVNQALAEGPVAVVLSGLTPPDAARLQQSARMEMQRDQALWSRDYQAGAADGAGPGRIAGIPRTLRVRR